MEKFSKKHLSKFDIRFLKAQRFQLSIIQNLAYTIWPISFKDILVQSQIDYMLNWMYSKSKLEENFGNGDDFYLLEIDNNFSGYMHIEYVSTEKVKIQKLYILPSLHGHGFGKFMLNELLVSLKETYYKKLELQVNRNNKAVHFYLNFGFEIVESKDFEIGNGYFMNDYIMHYHLNN